MISVSDLEFAYPGSTFSLRIPMFKAAAGERVAIVGPSGSGKTSLLNLLAGIQTPQSGSIRVDGEELTSMPDAKRRTFRIARIGMVFQDFALIEYLNVLENVLLPYYVNPALKMTAESRARAEALARGMGLGDKLRRRIDCLSQGERQRAAVCRALLTQPKLLLADEPTGNLDPANKGQLLALLFEQAAETGATLITVTHDHSLLDAFDRTVDFQDFGGGGDA